MPAIRICALALLAAATLVGSAQAQRNGNTYDGVHNQPTQGNVHAKEEAAGVAPKPPPQRRATQETDRLYNQLMKDEGVRGPVASETGPVPPVPVR